MHLCRAHFFFQGTFPIVLMTVADSSYVFRLINVEAPGRMSHGGVFKRSPIGQRLQAGLLGCRPVPSSPRQLQDDTALHITGRRGIPAEARLHEATSWVQGRTSRALF